MHPHYASANATKDAKATRERVRTDNIHTKNPRQQTIHDPRFREVFVIHSRPTR